VHSKLVSSSTSRGIFQNRLDGDFFVRLGFRSVIEIHRLTGQPSQKIALDARPDCGAEIGGSFAGKVAKPLCFVLPDEVDDLLHMRLAAGSDEHDMTRSSALLLGGLIRTDNIIPRQLLSQLAQGLGQARPGVRPSQGYPGCVCLLTFRGRSFLFRLGLWLGGFFFVRRCVGFFVSFYVWLCVWFRSFQA